MQVTVLGCSGSVGGPSAPSSGYLVSMSDGREILMDIGSGVLGALQVHTSPSDCDLLLTHAHADHIVDFPGLLVWRKFHPTAPARQRNLLVGPEDMLHRLKQLCLATGDENDAEFDTTFSFQQCQPGIAFESQGARITAYPMVHPVPTVGYRVENDGAVVAYTGDTGWTDSIVDLARDADIFICEATWCGSDEGMPANMHLSGAEAGRAARQAAAKTLVLTHIPPYGDAAACLAAAQSEFDGEVVIAKSGMRLFAGR